MRHKRLAVTLVLMIIAGQSTADEYVVQFGALKQPYEAYAKKARQIGSVITAPTKSGLTLYKLGPYKSGTSAREAMGQLRLAGYRDAYVKRSVSRSSISNTEMAPTAAMPSKAVASLQDISALPNELRSKVVYVDGVLHVKEGDRFTPLNQYPQ